jgi:hypothetical protein
MHITRGAPKVLHHTLSCILTWCLYRYLTDTVFFSVAIVVVFITSNYSGNSEIMQGCKEAGIPAFGTLWDFVGVFFFFFWLLQRLTLTSERSNRFSGCYLIRVLFFSHTLLVDGVWMERDMIPIRHDAYIHTVTDVCSGAVCTLFFLPSCTMMQLVAPGVQSGLHVVLYLTFYSFYFIIVLPCSFSGKTTMAGVVCAPRTGGSRLTLSD